MLRKSLRKLRFRNYFDSAADCELGLQFMGEESLKSGLVAVRAITIFELVMLALWITSQNTLTEFYSRMYLLSYISLLLISLFIHVVLMKGKRTGEHLGKRVTFCSYFYSTSLFLWALMITFLDISKSGYFSSLVYMTIIVIIPVTAFIEPYYYLLLNVIGSVTVISLLLYYCDLSKNRGNLINFTVFAIISMISGCAYMMIRISGYANRVKLHQANTQLRNVSEHDHLSGLYNRHKLGTISDEIWEECILSHEKLTCVLCDLDNFKRFNDLYGHDCGDDCIRLVADTFREMLLEGKEYCFRYGGEEFLLLFPKQEYEYAQQIMIRIQDKLKASRLEGVDANGTVTMSVGIYTGLPSREQRIQQYFTKADSYMYEAKMQGKDCIRGCEDLLP